MSHFRYLFLLLFGGIYAQELPPLRFNADLDIQEDQTIKVSSQLELTPEYFVYGDSLYLYDWNHSYSSKVSPLAKSFRQVFDRRLHLAAEKDRGRTIDLSIKINDSEVPYSRIEFDILAIKIPPENKTNPLTLNIDYTLYLPDIRFTGYGKDKESFILKNQFIIPVPKEDERLRAHHFRQRGNQRSGIVSYNIRFNNTKKLFIESDLPAIGTHQIRGVLASPPAIVINYTKNTTRLTKQLPEIVITNDWLADFDNIEATLDRVLPFLVNYLAGISFRPLLILEQDYKERPLVGIDDIPSFLSPYPSNFIEELKLLKTIARKYLQLNFDSNPELEQFYIDGFSQYLLQEYVSYQYPNLSFSGKFASWWPIKKYYLGQIDFNHHFQWLDRYIENKNSDQPLLSRSDQLLNYNWQIAHPIRSAQLFDLSISDENKLAIRSSLKSYQLSQYLKPGASAFDLKWYLPSKINAPIVDRRFLSDRNHVDFKLHLEQQRSGIDFLRVSQNGAYAVPVKVAQMIEDSILNEKWVYNSKRQPYLNFENQPGVRYVVNPNLESPEFKTSNNVLNPRSKLFAKPIKILPFTDLPSAAHNNLFITPQANFNLYDGVAAGLSFSNQSLLNKPMEFQITPLYSSKENTVIGNFSVLRNHWVMDRKRTRVSYGIFGASQHFNKNSLYTTLTPFIRLSGQDPDLNKRHRNSWMFRYRLVSRSYDNQIVASTALTNPDYGVLNIRHQQSTQSLFDFQSTLADLQISNHFIKLSGAIEYRKLFTNNTQLSARLFAGAFIKNNTNDDYFSFGVNGPNDYLYDYNLIGRSESSGLFSQQLVRAEGAFVSEMVNREFANRGLITLSTAINLYRFIEMYTEIALRKDLGQNAEIYHGSGIRLNLVPDFLEIYLPVHHQKGYISFTDDYLSKVRFVLALRFETLSRLFTRSLF